MKKILRLSIISLFSFIISFAAIGLFGANAHAQNAADPVVATVNIYDAKIESQSGNTFSISFDITNGKGVQPGIKYGVKLFKSGSESQTSFDEHVYDEVLSLGENQTVHRTITYTAPATLNGDYDLWIFSRNTSGFPFALATLGKVTLTAQAEGLSIQNDTCFLTVEGEKGSPHYTLGQGVDILASENLIGSCQVQNSSKEDITATPQFETRERNSFGNKVEDGAVTNEAVTFKAGEIKTVSLRLPKALTPQAYDAKLMFVDGKNVEISNEVVFHYVLRGASATIQRAITDKDSYKKGETATVSVFTTGSADSFRDSRYGTSTPLGSATIEAQILSGGLACSDISSKQFVSGENTFNILLSGDCPTPVVAVSIKNNGEVIAQNNFSIETPKIPGEKAENDYFAKGFSWPIALAAFSLLLLLIALLLKKKSAGFSVFLFMFLGGLGMFSGSASATTIAYFPLNPDGSMHGHYSLIEGYGTVNINKTTFSPGESLVVSGSVESTFCSNQDKYLLISMANISSNSQHPSWNYSRSNYPYILAGGNNSSGSLTLQAPLIPGTYYIHTSHSDARSGDYFYGYIDIPFTVVSPNNPPTPPVITGPGTAYINTDYPFTFTSTDPEGDPISYLIDWDNSGSAEETTRYTNGGYNSTRQYPQRGTITIRAQAKDSKGAVSTWSTYTFPVVNRPPTAPTITVPTSPANTYKVGQSQSFTFTSTDPDGDTIHYMVSNWGDGTTFSDRSYFPSGTPDTYTHTWSTPGTYTITAYAQDNQTPAGVSPNSTRIVTITATTTTVPLSATCSASPGTAQTGSAIVWTAVPSGGSGTYTYSWSGTDSLTGSAASVSKAYTTAGGKSAFVTVTEVVSGPVPSGSGAPSHFVAVSCGTVTVTTPPVVVTPLSVSCSANPGYAQIGDAVVWNATVSGGSGTYTYSWSGTDGLSGTTAQVTKSYSSSGAKGGYLTVSDNGTNPSSSPTPSPSGSGTPVQHVVSCNAAITVASPVPGHITVNHDGDLPSVAKCFIGTTEVTCGSSTSKTPGTYAIGVTDAPTGYSISAIKICKNITSCTNFPGSATANGSIASNDNLVATFTYAKNAPPPVVPQNCDAPTPGGSGVKIGPTTYVPPATSAWTYISNPNATLASCQWTCKTGFIRKSGEMVCRPDPTFQEI